MTKEETLIPPVAKRIPTIKVIHGYEEIDEYGWMADKTKSDPDILAYLKAENDYADGLMRATVDSQENLYREMLGRIRETDENVPYRKGGYYYYTRTETGRQYPIYARKCGSLDAPEEVTLDLNLMSDGREYFSIGAYEVSDDGRWLAFTTDESGFRQYTLFVKDLQTGRITERLAERVTGVAWAADNQTIFYTQEEEVTKRSNRLYRLAFGVESPEIPAEPELLYEENDELYRLGVDRTRSGHYLVLTSSSFTTSEVRVLEIGATSTVGANGDLRLILPRRDNHEYYLDHRGESFYIRTNDQGKNFRLVTVPVTDPSPAGWREVVPHRPEVMIEDVECFATHFLTIERKDGLSRMSVHYPHDLENGQNGGDGSSGVENEKRFSHSIDLPEPVYVASPQVNPEFESTTYRFSYESLVTPRTVFDYDVRSRERNLLKQQPVLGGFDPAAYESERRFATASDGRRIPISIVYRKESRADGPSALLLEAYGSYGISNDVDFSSNRLSLLDRGVIYAVAHIRGGGELGKEWHDQGKMMLKKNTFTDFIACAEYLISSGDTTAERLVITGGSAGGLLMGAVANMRPDLFRAIVSYVPFVDVMNTMLDASLPLTVGEYLEWGDPNEKPAYDYMRSYSPYENIGRQSYPTMLIRTSLNDSQVMYWEPAKYVARLRTMKTDQNPLLFKVKLEPGGHGGASGRYDRLRDTAFDYAFILGEAGAGQAGAGQAEAG
ncbi:MAG: S9 family peptidase, partial [Blastocatellia bacterium]